jgi:hypothetical protein
VLVKINNAGPMADIVASPELQADVLADLQIDMETDGAWLPFAFDTLEICPLCEEGRMQPDLRVPDDNRDWETCLLCGFTQPVGGGK